MVGGDWGKMGVVGGGWGWLGVIKRLEGWRLLVIFKC